MWSAGVVLFIMVTGSMPFPERDAHVCSINVTLLIQAMVRLQRARQLRYPSRAEHVSHAARSIIHQLLNPDSNNVSVVYVNIHIYKSFAAYQI